MRADSPGHRGLMRCFTSQVRAMASPPRARRGVIASWQAFFDDPVELCGCDGDFICDSCEPESR
jgi:hypothetical protein